MAVADVAQFQWYKFCNSFQESQTEVSAPALISRIRDTKKWLEENHDKFIAASPEESQNLLCRLNDALSQCRISAHKNIFRFNPLAKKYFLWKQRQNLDTIEASFKKLQGLSSSIRRRLLPISPSSSAIDEATTVRFDEMAVEVEDVLLGRNVRDHSFFNAYGITGMPGAGKTVLTRQVFNSPTIRQEFPIRIWVCLSDVEEDGDNNADVEIKIVKYMLEQLNYDPDEELRGKDTDDIIQLLTELKKRLSKNKYLIVFDDIQWESKWYENLPSQGEQTGLSYGLPKGANGGAVIVTGRVEDLVKRMVGEHSFTTCLDQENEYTELSKRDRIMTKMAIKIENVLFGRGGKDFIAYGITGMVGSGKSALARQVFNSDSICDEFSTRIWVCLSNLNRFDIEQDHNMNIGNKIVKHMLDELSYDADQELRGTDDTNDIVHLLTELKKRLSKRKYLIVLDGVWQENKWYENLLSQNDGDKKSLSFGLPKATGANGGAVVVTGRSEDLVRRVVGEHSLITRINPDSDQLLQEKCWKIFEENLKKNGTILDHQALAKIEDDIKYKIQGLPLAAKTLAHIIPKLM